MGRVKGHLILGMLVLVAGCGSKAGVFELSNTCDCGFLTNANTGELFHWEDGKIMVLGTEANFPEEFYPALVVAQDAYDNLFEKMDIEIDQNTGTTRAWNLDSLSSLEHDNNNGIYWVTGDWPFQNHEDSDAVTNITFTESSIVEVDIFFRADHFQRTAEGLNGGILADIETLAKASRGLMEKVQVVAAHELGHALGRIHAGSGTSSIMTPKISLDLAKNPLTTYDKSILSKVYELRE